MNNKKQKLTYEQNEALESVKEILEVLSGVCDRGVNALWYSCQEDAVYDVIDEIETYLSNIEENYEEYSLEN